MEKDWIKIFASDKLYQAEMVKGLLQANDIEAVVINRQDSSYLQVLPGLAEVYIHQSRQDKAKALLSESGLDSE